MTARAGVDRDHKAADRAMWALGDYHRFAKADGLGARAGARRACGISAGQRVLDVAAGTGNVAIRAAEAGAEVVASDLTPENFDAGRREAATAASSSSGSRRTPRRCRSPTASSTSSPPSFGAMFAPDHQAVADELLRVCRPGGTIGMINFTPEGLARRVLRASRTLRAAAPPGGAAPVLWGSEDHVRELFGDRVGVARADPREYVERAGEPARLRRALQGDVRAGRCAPRAPGRPARSGGGVRPRVPGVRHAREPRPPGRAGRVPLRVPARGRPQALVGGYDETQTVSSARAARPEDGVLSRVDSAAIERSLRPCLGTTIAPRERAAFRQTLLGEASRAHEPALVREHDRLHAVAQAELAEDAGDVRLDRVLADDELGCDLGVRESPGEQPEHLELAGGELVERGRRRGLAASAKRSMRRRVTEGANIEPPSAATRIAATSCCSGASFRRNPLAPARSAAKTYSSRSNVVRTRTAGAAPGRRGSGASPRSRRARACGRP